MGPASTADAAVDPELADFQAEINAIEVETAEAERAKTPPPDQQTFLDDDGTMYKWDPALRRFLPAGGETDNSAQYNVNDMVYEAEDEKIPALPAVVQVSVLPLHSCGLARVRLSGACKPYIQSSHKQWNIL